MVLLPTNCRSSPTCPGEAIISTARLTYQPYRRTNAFLLSTLHCFAHRSPSIHPHPAARSYPLRVISNLLPALARLPLPPFSLGGYTTCLPNSAVQKGRQQLRLDTFSTQKGTYMTFAEPTQHTQVCFRHHTTHIAYICSYLRAHHYS